MVYENITHAHAGNTHTLARARMQLSPKMG